MLTAVPEVAVGAARDWTQNVSPAPVSIHWCTSDCPVPGVRATARSQSLPTPYTHEPAAVVVTLSCGAPDAAPPAADAPTPAAPLNATTLSDWW